MKKLGSTSDFMATRDRELLRAFRIELMESRGIPLRDLFGRAAKHSCSRFWVSEVRAAEVVSKLLKGEKPENFTVQKERMYQEILARVKRYQLSHPDEPLSNAVFKAVNSTAPEFYLTEKSAKVIIYRLRRKNAE